MTKHMAQRNISLVYEIIVKFMLQKAFFSETENSPSLSRIYFSVHF